MNEVVRRSAQYGKSIDVLVQSQAATQRAFDNSVENTERVGEFIAKLRGEYVFFHCEVDPNAWQFDDVNRHLGVVRFVYVDAAAKVAEVKRDSIESKQQADIVRGQVDVFMNAVRYL